MINVIYILFIFMIFSCDKVDSNPNLPPKGSSPDSLQIVWYKWISGKRDTLVRKCLKPLLFEKDVITTDYDLFSSELEVISSFKKVDGCLNWRWDDYYNRGRGNSGIYNGGVNYNNAGILYWSGLWSYYSIALNTGKTIQKLNADNCPTMSGKHTFSFNENEGVILTNYEVSDLSLPDTSKLIVLNQDLQIRKVLYFLEKDDWLPGVTWALSYISQNDTLVLGSIELSNWDSMSTERSEIFCYSLGADSMLWIFKGIDKGVRKNPAIYDGKYYFVAGSDFYCLDILTGRLVWKRSLNLPLAYRFVDPLTIAEGKIFARNSIGDTYCLNASNGLVIWANTLNEETGASGFAEGAKIEYYKGRLYYSDNMMYVLDAVSGRLIKKYKVPKSVPQYAENYIQGITIDPETDLMYFTDGYHLICAKVPE